ncbi:serine/threonine protein kinase [Xanthomonas citri pv. citri]
MQIAEAAQAIGIRDLRQSALMNAAHGVTSLAEITRVTKDEGLGIGESDQGIGTAW